MNTKQDNADRVTMLEHLGGLEYLKKFVEHFHKSLLADELLTVLFINAKPTHAAHLFDFLEEVMGGRKLYTERHNGVEGLFDAHENLCITEEQRGRFVELMLEAADAVGLPNDERFRSALTKRIKNGSMFSMRLSQLGAKRLTPPWPPVGTYDW